MIPLHPNIKQAFHNIKRVSPATIVADFDDQLRIRILVNPTICENCKGHGKHLQTSLRNIAFTSDEDPEFIEDMKEGKYDVTCIICNGGGRVMEVSDVIQNEAALEQIRITEEVVKEIKLEQQREQQMLGGC